MISFFLLFKQFIYLGELDSNLNTEDALNTLYAAKKYDIIELEIECLRFLKQQISEDNVVTIFQAAQLFEEKELRDDAQAFLKRLMFYFEKYLISRILAGNILLYLITTHFVLISRNFDIIMKREDFLNISMHNLSLFLKDDDTFASELAIFQGVMR